jgi:hypothetical protein
MIEHWHAGKLAILWFLSFPVAFLAYLFVSEFFDGDWEVLAPLTWLVFGGSWVLPITWKWFSGREQK